MDPEEKEGSCRKVTPLSLRYNGDSSYYSPEEKNPK